MSNTSSNNTRIAKNTILLFPVCYLQWLYLCVQAVLEKMPQSAIPLYTNTSEVVECIYGSSIVRFYDKQGNETEMVAMKTESDTSGIIMNKWLINQIDIECQH